VSVNVKSVYSSLFLMDFAFALELELSRPLIHAFSGSVYRERIGNVV
jgi:hypothetical protein